MAPKPPLNHFKYYHSFEHLKLESSSNNVFHVIKGIVEILYSEQ